MFQVTIDLPLEGTAVSNAEPKCLRDSLFKDGQFTSTVGKVERVCRRLMKVRVYRNLNKPEFYSIMAMEGEDKGRVIGYARSVLLENCQLVVSEKSRQRVLKEKRKNVHAFCQGVIVDASEMVQTLDGTECVVTYNPYKMGSFFRRDDETPFTDSCTQALLQGSDVHITEGNGARDIFA